MSCLNQMIENPQRFACATGLCQCQATMILGALAPSSPRVDMSALLNTKQVVGNLEIGCGCLEILVVLEV